MYLVFNSGVADFIKLFQLSSSVENIETLFIGGVQASLQALKKMEKLDLNNVLICIISQSVISIISNHKLPENIDIL